MSLVCQRDPKLYTQCCLVGLHWSRMCHILGLSAQQIEQLLPGVLMHDERIDKLALQEEILEDKLIQGIYSFPDSLSKENCLLLVADTFVRCLLDTRDLQVSIKGLSHRLRVSPWMKEKISSQISYLPHTYQNRKKTLRTNRQGKRLFTSDDWEIYWFISPVGIWTKCMAGFSFGFCRQV